MAKKKNNTNNMIMAVAAVAIIIVLVWFVGSYMNGNQNVVGDAVKKKATNQDAVSGSPTQPLCSWSVYTSYQCRVFVPGAGTIYDGTETTDNIDHQFVNTREDCVSLCMAQKGPYPGMSCSMGFDIGGDYHTYTGSWFEIHTQASSCIYNNGNPFEQT